MADSAVEICNRALNAIGQAAITALDEGTPRADLCNRLYTDLRDELLQDHPWNFALRREVSAALTSEPAFEWTYEYAFPTNAVRIISVNEDWQRVLWASEGRKILTDEASPINVRYVTNDLVESDFPPLFTAALVLRIALDLAVPMTDSAAKREALAKEFRVAISRARGADARESGPRQLMAETFIDARR